MHNLYLQTDQYIVVVYIMLCGVGDVSGVVGVNGVVGVSGAALWC